MPALGLDGAPCPCSPGYTCCPVANVCVAAGAACPASGNCPLPPSAAKRCEVGQGDPAAPSPVFLALPADGRVPLHRGPQGGYHVYLQVRTLGIDPSGVTFDRYIFDPADAARTRETALRYQSDLLSLVCVDDQAFVLLQGELTYLCPSQSPGQAMAGRDLVARVELHDRAGRMLVDQRIIHPECPADDPVCLRDSFVGCAAP